MRNGYPVCPTVAPAPPTCGGMKRAATDDITAYALKPWIGVTFARSANPGIFELCHSIGNVIGVFPSTLKSYALFVYFQMYSPLTTKCRPATCCNPAWYSLRYPGDSAPESPAWPSTSGFTTGFRQPWLASTRFSLNGVSSVRAYDARSTVFVRLMLY